MSIEIEVGDEAGLRIHDAPRGSAGPSNAEMGERGLWTSLESAFTALSFGHAKQRTPDTSNPLIGFPRQTGGRRIVIAAENISNSAAAFFHGIAE